MEAIVIVENFSGSRMIAIVAQANPRGGTSVLRVAIESDRTISARTWATAPWGSGDPVPTSRGLRFTASEARLLAASLIEAADLADA